MKIDWESKNMAWRLWVSLDWEGFYFCAMIAGVDIEFHIHNLRSLVYRNSRGRAK